LKKDGVIHPNRHIVAGRTRNTRKRGEGRFQEGGDVDQKESTSSPQRPNRKKRRDVGNSRILGNSLTEVKEGDYKTHSAQKKGRGLKSLITFQTKGKSTRFAREMDGERCFGRRGEPLIERGKTSNAI